MACIPCYGTPCHGRLKVNSDAMARINKLHVSVQYYTGSSKPAAGQLQSERLQQQLVQLAAKRQHAAVQQDVQQPWQFTQQFHFDPAACGSYPCRQQLQSVLWRDLAACHQAVAQALAQQDKPAAASSPADAAVGCADPLQNPFGWVPEEPDAEGRDNDGTAAGDQEAAAAQAQISSIRPKTAQIRSRTVTSLPLEFFDSPEMEQVDIEQQLQEVAEAGMPGLQALSRFYSPDGSFSWKPCTVLQHDRCAWLLSFVCQAALVWIDVLHDTALLFQHGMHCRCQCWWICMPKVQVQGACQPVGRVAAGQLAVWPCTTLLRASACPAHAGAQGSCSYSGTQMGAPSG